MNKTGLSPYDDKSYYVDRKTALRYGHKNIKMIKEKNGVAVSEDEIETIIEGMAELQFDINTPWNPIYDTTVVR